MFSRSSLLLAPVVLLLCSLGCPTCSGGGGSSSSGGNQNQPPDAGAPCTPAVAFADPGGTTTTKDVLLELTASGCSILEPAIRTVQERYFPATPLGGRSFRRWMSLEPGSNDLAAVVFSNGGVETQAGTTSWTYTPITPAVAAGSGFIAATVRGQDSDQPLEDALVWVRGIPGELRTNAQGQVLFPTPTGGRFLLNVTLPSYTSAQRTVDVVAGHQARVEDVFLVQLDGSAARLTPEQGGTLSNAAGDLQLSVPAGAVRAPVDVSGVSFGGDRALPDKLPDSSRWTQAFDLQPDGVRFDQPATVRVANTQNFPPGMLVPVGSYNRDLAAWEPEGMGAVTPDGAWIELQVRHFSSYDCNFPARERSRASSEDIVRRGCVDLFSGASQVGQSYGELRLFVPVGQTLRGGEDRVLRLEYDSRRARPRLDVLQRACVGSTDGLERVEAQFTVEGARVTVGANAPLGEVVWAGAQLDAVDGAGMSLAPGVYAVQVRLQALARTTYMTTGVFGAPGNEDTGIQTREAVPFESTQTLPVALLDGASAPFGAGWRLESDERLWVAPELGMALWDRAGTPAFIAFGAAEPSYVEVDEAVLGDRPLRFHILDDGRILLVGANGVYQAADMAGLPTATSLAQVPLVVQSARGPNGLVLLDATSNLIFMQLDGTVTRTVPIYDAINNLRNELQLGPSHPYRALAVDRNGMVYIDLHDYGFVIVDTRGADPVLRPVKLLQFPGPRNHVSSMTYAAGEHALYLGKPANDVVQRYNLAALNEGTAVAAGSVTADIADATSIFRVFSRPDGTLYYLQSQAGDFGRYTPLRIRQRLMHPAHDGALDQCALIWADFFADGTPLVSCQVLGGSVFRFSRVSLSSGLEPESGARLTASGNLWVLAGPSGRRTFDAQGRLVERQTQDGTETLVRNANGLASVTDAFGNQTRFTYAAGRLSVVTDDAGHSVAVSVNGAGNLVSMTDGDGHLSSFSYDPQHLMLSRSVDGESVTYTWDALGGLATASQTTGEQRQFTGLFQSVAAAGVVDDANAVAQYTDGAGMPTTVRYGAGGVVASVERDGTVATRQEASRNNERRVAISVDGHAITQVVSPLGEALAYDGDAYLYTDLDDLGRTERVYMDGHVCDFSYASINDNPQSMDCWGETYVEFAYTTGGLLQSITDYDGNTWGVTVDGSGNLEQLAYPLGGTLQVQRNSAGYATSLQDPEGHTTLLTRDGAGNVVGIRDPAAQSATLTYTRVPTCPGCEEHGVDVLASVTDATGRTWTYSVRPDGQYQSFTNPLGQETRIFSYDGRRNLAGVAATGNPSGVALTQNAFDQLTQVTADGDARTYSYGDAGRLVQAISTDFQITRAYVDHANGDTMTESVTDMVTGISTWVTTGTRPRFTMLRGYSSSAGHDYALAGDALFEGVDQNQTALATTEVYWSAGVPTYFTSYDTGGTTVLDAQLTLDELRRPIQRDLYLGVNQNFVDGVAYTYEGTRPWVRDAVATNGAFYPTVSYTRDARSWLTGVSGDVNGTWLYDAGGRITQSSHAGTFTYDTAGRLQSTAQATYTYQPRGTRLSQTAVGGSERWAYTFNGAEQLVLAEKFMPATAATPASTVALAYDPLGRLTRITADGARTHLLWMDQLLVAELDGSGALVRRYVPSLVTDQVAIIHQGGTDYYVVEDEMASVLALVDGAGQAVARYTYDPWGRVLSATGPMAVQPRRFHGAYYVEALGLYYLRARWYDPEIGQFISEDPAVYVTAYPHPYRFAANDPTRFFDCSGFGPCPGPSNDFMETTTRDAAFTGSQFAPQNGGLYGTAANVYTFGTGLQGHKQGNTAAIKRYNAYNDARNFLSITKLGNSPVMRKATSSFLSFGSSALSAGKLARLRVLGPCEELRQGGVLIRRSKNPCL